MCAPGDDRTSITSRNIRTIVADGSLGIACHSVFSEG
jgi:hypothetical protein